ncbi:MAG: ATP synthase subunit I [Bryobacterales bacterium]|nr:ATP synthase subunit I [Bryobacterales bacterium]
MTPATNPDPATEAAIRAAREKHAQTVARIKTSQYILTAGGVVGWLASAGLQACASFAVGAAVSIVSFTLLDRLTAAIAGGAVSGPGLAGSALRILLIGGLLFGILQIYKLHAIAIGTGLLITVAAITWENLRGTLWNTNLV